MKRIITITGNRNLSQDDLEIISSKMKELVNDPSVDTIYFGGAIGVDTAALLSALDFRSENSLIKLIVVVPDVLDRQPIDTRKISQRADQLIELKNVITVSDSYNSYHLRNHYMVDHSTEVVAFWNGQLRSGTKATMNYAEKNNKTVELVKIIGSD